MAFAFIFAAILIIKNGKIQSACRQNVSMKLLGSKKSEWKLIRYSPESMCGQKAQNFIKNLFIGNTRRLFEKWRKCFVIDVKETAVCFRINKYISKSNELFFFKLPNCFTYPLAVTNKCFVTLLCCFRKICKFYKIEKSKCFSTLHGSEWRAMNECLVPTFVIEWHLIGVNALFDGP